jgi:hypothetical protein
MEFSRLRARWGRVGGRAQGSKEKRLGWQCLRAGKNESGIVADMRAACAEYAPKSWAVYAKTGKNNSLPAACFQRLSYVTKA